MRTILDVAYHVKAGASVLVSKLRDFLSTLVVAIVFLLSLTVLPVWEAAIDAAQSLGIVSVLNLGGLFDILVNVLSFILVLLVFGGVYTLVPSRRQPFRIVLVSASAAAILWEIAKEGFGIYITNVASFNRVYGAYAFLIIIGFWIYYTSVVFAIGAEIGQLYRERRRQHKERQAAGGHYRFFR
jgi:membrane protein